MKLNFTKFGMMLFLLIGASSLIGQEINTLTITAPAEVEGNYITTFSNGWGAQPTGTLTGSATFLNDGVAPETNACDGAPADIADWAFVDRGECSFVDKALAAQGAGAQAIVICNNAPLEGLPPLGFDDMGPFAQVIIPVFGLSFEDCQRIRVVAETGSVDVTAQYFCGVPSYGPEVVWGTNPGEGDFDGGPNGWTVTSESGGDTEETSWRWSDSASVPGAFSTGASIVEGTACNGYMVFPSDFYDNAGTSNPTEFMSGTCPVDPLNTVMCNGSLFSPNIDLSGTDATGLTCQFYHDWGYYYNGYTSLIVSYDDGATWPDTTLITVGEPNPALQAEIDFNDGCTPPSAAVNDRGEGAFVIPIRSYAGEDQIKLQFRHSGGYYHATIDDVILVEGGFEDIEIRRGYYAQSPAAAMPASQAQDIPLHVDIFNQGALDATDVSVSAQGFINGNATPVFTTVNDQFADQPAFCFLNENFSFFDAYKPEGIVGSHRVLYTNETPGDAIPANDTLSFGFELTETTWRTTEQSVDNFMFDNLITRPVGVDYAVAYPFYIPNGEGQFLNQVRLGVLNQPTNTGDLSVYLYEWNPGELSFPAGIVAGNQYTIDPNETTLVGVAGEAPEYGGGLVTTKIPLVGDPVAAGIPIQNNILLNMVKANPADGTQDFTPQGGMKALSLKDDQQYVLVITIAPADAVNVELLGQSSREGTPYYQTATNAAAFYNGSTRRYTPSVVDLFDNGSFAEVDNLVFENGFGADMPWIEMEISPNALSSLSGVEDITEEANASVSIFPNPVSDFLNIDINLEEVSPQVNVELMDINGQLVRNDVYTDVKNGSFKMEVKALTAGVYTLNVRSEAGFTTRKVVIQD